MRINSEPSGDSPAKSKDQLMAERERLIALYNKANLKRDNFAFQNRNPKNPTSHQQSLNSLQEAVLSVLRPLAKLEEALLSRGLITEEEAQYLAVLRFHESEQK